MGRLAGRATLITATGDAPGDSLVRILAGEGALIAANHIRPEVAERSAAIAIAQGSRGIPVGAHLLDRQAVANAVARVVDEFGRLDILVANATWFIPNDPENSGDAEWSRIVERNLRAQIHAVEAAVPVMKRQGYGKIVIMASVAGQMGMKGYTYYCMAKAGEIGYMRALAQELGPAGIRVNAIASGAVNLFGYSEEQQARMSANIPVGRVGHVDELSAMTVYLASEESDFVTGQTFRIDGGLLNA